MDIFLEYEDLNIVDSWYKNLFTPMFYRQKLSVSAAELTTAGLPEMKLAAFNRALIKMAVFMNFLKQNTDGFKINAQAQRVQRVEADFVNQRAEIEKAIANLGLSVVRVKSVEYTSDNDYLPFAINSNYKTVAETFVLEKTAIIMQQQGTIVSDSPSSEIVPVKTTTTLTPTITTPGQNTGSGSGLVIGGLGLLALLIFLATKKDKKDQKTKK